MKSWYIGAIFLFFLSLVGCGSSMNDGSSGSDTGTNEEELWEHSLTGYVADKDDSRILLIGKITKEQLEQMSIQELLETASPEAYWLKVQDIEAFKIGQKLEVWPIGGMMESYPAQGEGGKVIILEERK
ncbi:YobA family protein [Pseudalkalibacillus sp. Hm43]|uniref:YobA family protein n=1 Tax=Pseudalkalibacillus sp. Hm43 TaxID=3450742 RepID=UPI003F430B79